MRHGAAVRIHELEKCGVDPIDVSIGDVDPSVIPVPLATSASSSVEVSIEVPDPSLPVYRITLRNTSPRHARAFAFKGYRDGTEALSGRQDDLLRTPVLKPGGDVTFQVSTGVRTRSNERWRPVGLDHFAMTAVLWEDGLLEGDVELAAVEQSLAHREAWQLERVLALLNQQAQDPSPSGFTSLAGLRRAIQDLPVDVKPAQVEVVARRLQRDATLSPDKISLFLEMGRGQVKDAILANLPEPRTPSNESNSGSMQAWVATAIPELTAWLSRVNDLLGR